MQTCDSDPQLLVLPPAIAPQPAVGAAAPPVGVLGVNIVDLSMREAVNLLDHMLAAPVQQPQTVFFVNAHTLNLAYDDPDYRDLLNSATCVFGDGTGVRWAARLNGVRLKANLNGTDLIPELLKTTETRGYRYFLLGATPLSVARAAQQCQLRFPGWELCGYQHGYFGEHETRSVIERINFARPNLLLVGMGNPLQERWIARHRDQLEVRVCAGIGGLFNYWSGELDRAPGWLRRLGHEWAHILWRQKHKWHRYLIGNPKYLLRIARCRLRGDSI